MIVAAGTVLGLAYNGAGLMSRPPRGIPWVGTKADLPELESLAPPDSTAGTATALDPAPRVTKAPRVERAGGGPVGSAPVAPAPARADSGSTASSSAETSPEARTTAPVPFIPEADRPIQVKLATAKSLFDASAALFLDARDAGEYEAGHIPGAMRLTRDDALSEPDRVKALAARGRPIVTYCDGGACEASLDLARALVDAGYRKVLVFSGGFPEWAAAGHPVEHGEGGR